MNLTSPSSRQELVKAFIFQVIVAYLASLILIVIGGLTEGSGNLLYMLRYVFSFYLPILIIHY